MDDVAVGVAEDLDFDVFGAADVAFQKNGGVAECGTGFLAGFGEFGFEGVGRIDNTHAAAAAPEGSFDDEREADVFGESFDVGTDGCGSGDDGNAGCLREFAGGGLVTERVEQFGVRTNEGDAGALAGSRQCRVFGEEAVAGMNGVDVFIDGEIDDGIDVQIGLDRAFALADEIRLVGFEAVEAEAVFLGVDGNGSEAEFSGGAEDAGGDFAPVQC